MKKIEVHSNCIGCGACVSICPEVFDFNEDGISTVIESNNDFDVLEEEVKNSVTDALESCPVTAITIEEEKAA